MGSVASSARSAQAWRQRGSRAATAATRRPPFLRRQRLGRLECGSHVGGERVQDGVGAAGRERDAVFGHQTMLRAVSLRASMVRRRGGMSGARATGGTVRARAAARSDDPDQLRAPSRVDRSGARGARVGRTAAPLDPAFGHHDSSRRRHRAPDGPAGRGRRRARGERARGAGAAVPALQIPTIRPGTCRSAAPCPTT